MTRSPKQKHKVAGNWDVYWHGTHENAAHQEGGAQDAVLAQFWGELFQRHMVRGEPQHLLDLACGNGAVTGFALQVAPQTVTACCLDYSVSAVLELQKRYPGTLCVAADTLHAPFANGSFDMVCSQFGIEYAGVDSISEAARLVAPQGILAAILHLRNGAIYKECAQNLRAIVAIQESGLLPEAHNTFNAGFALNAGTGDVTAFKTAERAFAPKIKSLEGILRDMGSDVAAGLPQQLYRDIAHMYRRMSAYAQEDVIAWIEGMIRELAAYNGRMSSMIDAAMDERDMQRVEKQVAAHGLTLKFRRILKMGAKPEPGAWVLVCERV